MRVVRHGELNSNASGVRGCGHVCLRSLIVVVQLRVHVKCELVVPT